ncbi:MAG: hypothetical protein MJZ67_00225 [Bacteroidales bacterium]|nr:hypothetical protein [Bacteroidales bacterium]
MPFASFAVPFPPPAPAHLLPPTYYLLPKKIPAPAPTYYLLPATYYLFTPTTYFPNR